MTTRLRRPSPDAAARRRAALACAALLLALAALGGCGRQGGAPEQAPAASNAGADAAGGDARPVVPVRTAPAVIEDIAETRTVFGAIATAPAALSVLAAPFESRVERVLVARGQRVEQGDAVVLLAPGPDTRLQVEQGRNDVAAAEQTLKEVRDRFDAHLVTNADVLKAQQDLAAARTRLASFEERGAGGPASLLAPVAGVVSRVDAVAGQVSAQGATLVEVTPDDALEAQVGIAPADASLLRVGQEARVSGVQADGAGPMACVVRLIPQEVDPQSQLVQVRVSLPAGSRARLGAFVQAEITLAARRALVIPRAALTPEGDGFVVYTVRDGHAVRHVVAVGIESGDRVEITGDGIRPADAVVYEGNSELADGMAVMTGTAP